MNKAVTIVVPVYGDWPSLRECIESLKQFVDTRVHRVMLVNDCGPEVELMEKNILSAIDGRDGFIYQRNDKNLGFIKTCNRAVSELDKTDNDILLLNSDTKVTEGFLDEMLAVMVDAPRVATISPRSNNATICTIPLEAIAQKGIDRHESYELFRKYNHRFPRYSLAPTAHGFCMLIRRKLIEDYGLFDEVFGKGYGEEVDFCQRVKKHGWQCAISNRAYVFHLEARSFSIETKRQLLETNNQIIRSRYPDYKQAVTDYIDQALAEEAKLFGQVAGIRAGVPGTRNIKKLIKRNRRLHGLVMKLRDKIIPRSS